MHRQPTPIALFAALTALLATLLAAESAIAADAARPNILYILADDVGFMGVGCYGGESFATPRIDKLAAQGVRFTHCYSMPVCHPTRVCLLTGRYPRLIGSPGWGSFPKKLEDATLANTLQRAGYDTAVAGKWQLTLLRKDPNHPHRLGFDDYCLFGWHEGARYHGPLIWENGEKTQYDRDVYGPDVYTDFLIDFMSQDREQPFFAFYSMALAHDVTDDIKGHVPFPPGKEGFLSYAEMIASMDQQVGKLLDALDKHNLAENTLVVFTTDNGSPSASYAGVRNGKMYKDPVTGVLHGQKVRGGKGSLTDAGTRVPLIARWPGVTKQGVVDDLVDFSDFYPTFADLAGAKESPKNLNGQSFANRITKNQPAPRQSAYAEKSNGRWFVRTQDYKLYDDGKL